MRNVFKVKGFNNYMEFTPGRINRGGMLQTPSPPPPPHHPAAPNHPVHPPQRRKHIDWAMRTVRLELFIVIVGSALLLSAVALFLAFTSIPDRSEFNLVDRSKYQGVFLNGGFDFTIQTGQPVAYFGKITSLDDKHLILRNVYYLTTDSQQPQSNQSNVQLTKLGCLQLHAPYDTMIINRNQLAFWENLRDDGKVVKAIKEYQQQNPNGPDCSQQTQSSGSTQSTPTTTANPTPDSTNDNSP